MVSPSIYSHSQLISLLQYKNYDREIPFNKYMGNLILEQNLFGLMMDIICKEKGSIAFRAAWPVESRGLGDVYKRQIYYFLKNG